MQKNKFMHEQRLSNSDYADIKYETISFKSNLSLSIIFSAREIVKKHNIKNVIFIGASELKSLYFAFLGLNINLIVRHGTTKSNPKKDFFHKLIYSNVATHVAISDHLAKNVQHIVPFGESTKLVTIIPSMPKECSKKERINHDNIKLLHVGRITPGKGLKEALQACQILYENNIKFSLESYGAMSSNYKEKFHNFVESLAYKQAFKLQNFTNDIYDEYKAHDIFIFPTKGEGFGNVMMEALAHGIVCLAFDNTAITNFKEMGFHMHLVKDGDVDELAKTLLYISKHIEKELLLCEENVKKAKDLFSAKREALAYIDLLI